MRVTQKEKDEAIARLHEILKPGDRVFGIVRTVSRSGMSRTIDFFTFKDGDRYYLSGYIATALGYNRDKSGALKVQGCGMDMIFHVVYNLGCALFPEGFGVPCGHCGERPAFKDEGRQMWGASCPGTLDGIRKSGHEFFGRNADRSGWDSDGGYALKAETL